MLNSKYGPLLPAFSAQQIGNALGWGIVNDTPNSFVWEIGHTSDFTTPAGQFCVPGQTICDSYDTSQWLGFTPLKIKSVTFGNGSKAHQWADSLAESVRRADGPLGMPRCWSATPGGMPSNRASIPAHFGGHPDR